ncbi:aldehyde dehydrogenase family protein [Nocardioides stalactiti]|uniref:aldehyde dehydrogenase family protein n=1 Tax=Nocardioides stalactiti TaxID=2755356 RepID=UPI0016032D1D|nr:aldehyde dehydrogenase family protein [Nocardioides stalactiti]
METARLFIGGSWVESCDGATIDVRNPATGGVVGVIPAGAAEDVSAAVAAAVAAQPEWAALAVGERADRIAAAVDRVRPHVEELARLQTMEMGQPIALARDYTVAALDAIAGAAEASRTYAWVTALAGAEGSSTRIVRHPYGVGALVVPWNFPLLVGADSLGGLLATGNTVVFKPSERSPLSAVRLVELLDLPPGVLNLVLGDVRAGAPLMEHPDVGIAVLTGSTAAGRSVAAASAAHLRPALLELGGKDPVIVDDTVDPVWAAEQVALGAFHNTGQICTSMERLYVLDTVAEEFTRALVGRAAALQVGDPQSEGTDLGPLVDERQRRIVADQVDAAVVQGARVLTGGTVPDGPGSFYPPTVLVDVTDDMAIMREETFGPVAPIRVVASFDEALNLARDSSFGLAATVLSKDPDHIDAAATIPAAVVWVNEWWGGAEGMVCEPAKSSGVGVLDGLNSYTTPRVVHVGAGA